MRSINALILSSDRVSKEWSSSALKVLKGRECFIEVHINDWYLIIGWHFGMLARFKSSWVSMLKQSKHA